MPWLILTLVCAIALGFGAMLLGFIPPPHAATLLRVSNGRVLLKKGQLRAYAREQVTEILSEAGVTSGYIAILPQNKVMFSWQIPSSSHQRLRNVLLNQSS